MARSAGSVEITTWGAYDGSTWLAQVLDRDDTAPLLLDTESHPSRPAMP